MEHIKTPVRMECEGFLVDANGELIAAIDIKNRAEKGAEIVQAVNSHDFLFEALDIALHVFERIDRETPWSETEPDWWLDMTARMEVVRAALKLAGVK